MKEIRDVFGVNCIGTPKQLDEIYNLQNYERYWKPEFKKYFNVWISTNGTGVFYFIKKKYFHDLDGETNYSKVILDRFNTTLE